MKKTKFTIALLAVLIVSLLAGSAVTVFAETTSGYAIENANGLIGTYDTFAEALVSYDAAGDTYIKLQQNVDLDVEISEDVYLDLNGKKITGNINIAEGCTLYCMDSCTDDYDVEDGEGYGVITGTVTGDLQGLPEGSPISGNERGEGYTPYYPGYLKIVEDNEISFHRVDLGLESINFKPDDLGMSYACNFSGDQVVARHVKQYGVAINLVKAPDADSIGTTGGHSVFSQYVAGKGVNTGRSTRLVNIMRQAYTDALNKQMAELPIYGSAYLLTDDGYVFGAVTVKSLRQIVEAAEAQFSEETGSELKKKTIWMYRDFENVMSQWDLENIKAEAINVTATEEDIAALDQLYGDRLAYHGQLHDHANTGGTSDGKNTLEELKANLIVKDMDFTNVADHRQVLHMRLPEWDDTVFIGGSEAQAWINDSGAEVPRIHYNMMAITPEAVEAVLKAYPKRYDYVDDHFVYKDFMLYQIKGVAEVLYENGGLFVHVHPKSPNYMVSDDPVDYWYTEKMGIEVMTGCYGNMSAKENQDAYKLWTDLLAMGKKSWAMCGSDSHRLSDTWSLATVYATKKDAKDIFSYVRVGDVTAGPVGIRMSVGDAVTGSTTTFADEQRLVISVGDFHSVEYKPDHKYELRVYDENGMVFTERLSGNTDYYAMDVDTDVMFYRAEVYDATEDYVFAVGNPIWNG